MVASLKMPAALYPRTTRYRDYLCVRSYLCVSVFGLRVFRSVAIAFGNATTAETRDLRLMLKKRLYFHHLLAIVDISLGRYRLRQCDTRDIPRLLVSAPAMFLYFGTSPYTSHFFMKEIKNRRFVGRVP